MLAVTHAFSIINYYYMKRLYRQNVLVSICTFLNKSCFLFDIVKQYIGRPLFDQSTPCHITRFATEHFYFTKSFISSCIIYLLLLKVKFLTSTVEL